MRGTWAGAVTLILCCAPVMAGCSAPGQQQPVPSPTVDDSKVNNALYQCLIDEGFAVTRGENGEIQFVDPKDEQFSDYEEANQDCRAALVAQGLLPARSTDLLRVEYAALAAWHRCLVVQDFPLADWPSEEVFIEGEGEYNVLEATSPVDVTKAQEACPDEFAEVQQS